MIVADAKYDIMVPRRPAMATHKDLVIPKEPCSDTCVYHLNKSELELSDSQESRGTKFTRDQLNQLLALLPALETTGSSYCDAALVFAGPTCQEVRTLPFFNLQLGQTAEIRWRGNFEHGEPRSCCKKIRNRSWTIMANLSESPQIKKRRRRSSQVSAPHLRMDCWLTGAEISIDFSIPGMGYCTHLGPCDESCRCAGVHSACERTCHVRSQYETTYELILVRYQMPKALARLLVPFRSNQHHQEMYPGEMRV